MSLPGVYPDLKQRIRNRQFRGRTKFWSFLGYADIIGPLIAELNEAVDTGYITAEILLDDEDGETGRYKIRMTRADTTRFVDAAENFLNAHQGFIHLPMLSSLSLRSYYAVALLWIITRG